MKFSVLAVVAYATSVMGAKFAEFEVHSLFNEWKIEHGKSYGSFEEEASRLAVFEKNLELVSAHNEMHKKGQVSFSLAMNHLADLTNEEYKKGLLNYKSARANGVEVESTAAYEHKRPESREMFTLPASVDWTSKGAVTAVKNQGQCGSCWSFSSTGAMEGAHFLAGNSLVELSEQQLIDCVHSGQCTCSTGGLMSWAFEYVIGAGGIVSEQTAPYKSATTTCNEKPADFVAKFSSYANVTVNDEAALQSAVAQQPVAIAIDASSMFFQLYSSGVYDPWFGCCTSCTPDNLDHGVLATGYGTVAGGKDYWIVKNRCVVVPPSPLFSCLDVH